MSLFSRLVRGSSTESPTAEPSGDSRADTTQDPARVALEHDDPATRISAIDALGFGDALITLAGLAGTAPTPEAIQRAAQKRLAELIDTGVVTIDAVRARTTDSAALLSVAARAADTGLAPRLLDEIDDEKSLAQLAIQNSSHAVRRLAAERLQDPALVAQVLKEARGRDNNVYRILKSKRDALLAAERAAAESVKHTADLCATIERHEHQPFTDGYALALDHYAAQWQELRAHAPMELQQRADAVIERCRQVVALHRQQAAQREHEQAARAAALTEAVSERQQVLAALRGLLAGLYEEAIPDVETTLVSLQTRWSGSRALATPAVDDQHRFDRLREAVASLATLIASHGSVRQQAASLTNDGVGSLKRALIHLPLLGEDVPVAAHEASAALQAFEQAQLESLQSKDLRLSQIAALLRKAQFTLSAGQSRQAAGMRRSLEQKLRASPDLPPRLLTQLQSFDAQLELLQDWRSFVVAPKRTELIARMEALIDSDQKPVVLAKQIQQLQDEWKLISKGSTEDTEAEWQRFHDAGQKAYAPCREYFVQQAAVRAGNLERRAALLARLQEFAAAQDWEQPDWREVARALRESRLQWRNHQPVERSANRPLQESFEAVSLALQSRLEAEYARNADAMDGLIKRAQSLLEMGDARQAVDEIKRLQQQWKELGLVPQDRRAGLWEAFRQHCDAVYARQRAQHTEQQTLLEANVRAATEICAEVEGLLAVTGAELIENSRKLPDLRAAFAALGPTGDASRGVRVRFERALDQFERRLARQHEDDRARAWDLVLDAAGMIRSWRLAVATGAAPETRAALHQAAKSFVADVARWPKGVLQALQTALASEGSTDIAANEAQLRTLCIRTELLTGAPTPDADQDLRRQYQMQRLLKGLGQGNQTPEGGIEALALEWIAVGATTDAVYGELLPRAPRPSLR